MQQFFCLSLIPKRTLAALHGFVFVLLWGVWIGASGGVQAAVHHIRNLTVDDEGRTITLTLAEPLQEAPRLSVKQEEDNLYVLRLGQDQWRVAPGLLAQREAVLAQLQQQFPGLYYMRLDTAFKGGVVLKSTLPYTPSLCGQTKTQVRICLSAAREGNPIPQPPTATPGSVPQASVSKTGTTPGSKTGQPSVAVAQSVVVPSVSSGEPLTTTPTRTPAIPAAVPVDLALWQPNALQQLTNQPLEPALQTALQQYRSHQLDEAAKTLDTFLHTQPTPHAAGHYLQALVAVGQQRLDAALTALAAVDRAHAQAGLLKAFILVHLQRYEQADATLQAYRQQFAVNDEWHFLQGLTMEGQRQWQQASQAYQRCLAINPSRLDAVYHLAIVAVAQQQWTEALQQLDWVLFRQPDHVQALKARAYVQQRLNHPDQALASYQAALNPDMLFNYAVLAKKQANVQEARVVALAAQVLAQDNNPLLHYQLAFLLADLNEPRAAIASLETYLRLDPQGDDRRRKQATGLLEKLQQRL